MQGLVVGLVVVVLVALALCYLLVPSAMLSIVGIQGNPQVDFLVRALAAALLALVPGGLDCAAQGRHVVPAGRPGRAGGLSVRQFAG